MGRKLPTETSKDNPFISKKGNLINLIKSEWKLRGNDPQWLRDYMEACNSLGMDIRDVPINTSISKTNEMQTIADEYNYDSRKEDNNDYVFEE